jgi:arylsulfatase A-like enzyme
MKVLVLVAEGFHLGYLGCYGNDWVATPALDRLAAEGVVFDQHYSDRPDSDGARHAWRTGNYSFLGMSACLDRAGFANGASDLLHLLQSAGIPTALIMDSEQTREFASGWSKVYQLSTTQEKRAPMEHVLETAVTAIEALAEHEDWLLWVELSTLLPPWNIPDQFLGLYFDQESEEEDCQPLNPLTDPILGFVDKNDDVLLMRLQRTCAAAVSYLDSGFEALFEELRCQNLMEKLMIIVTTDRGFPLGEHGIVGFHQPWLHEELVHLPLLIKLPESAEAGRRILTLTQPVDVGPTVLEAFGRQIPNIHGYSLLPLIRGAKDSLRSSACSGLQINGACEWAIRSREWGYILPVQGPPADPPRAPQLYVKPDDRWEVNDVRQQNVELADSLEQVLRGFVQATQQPGSLQAPDLQAQGLQPLGVAPSNALKEHNHEHRETH